MAVVTGGARGIGRAIGALLVREGYVVVLTDLDGEAVRRTAAEVGAALGMAQDVRSEESHAEVLASSRALGELALWVNNAGVGDDGSLADLSSEAVRRLVEVNLLGVAWGMRAALDGFGPAGGDVLNIASTSALGPVPGLSVYAATKAAVLSLTMSVSVEAPDGVRLHALCPDGVDTDLVASMRADGRAKAMVHSSGRLRTVEEVADAAVSLVGSRRIVRTLPGWRSPLVRAGALIPSVSSGAFDAFEAIGRRVMQRR